MPVFNMATQTQGVVAAHSTFACSHPSHATFPFLKTSLLSFLCLLFSLPCLGQTTRTVPLESLSYSLDFSHDSLGLNDTAWITLFLGSPTTQVKNLHGCSLLFQFDTPSLIGIPNTLDVSASWLGTSGETSYSLNWDGSGYKLLLELHRTDDLGKTGSGLLLSFPIVSKTGLLNTDGLILSVSGGIILVENASLKQPQSTAGSMEPDWKIWPNPTSERVHWTPIESSGTISILNAAGQLLRQVPASEGRLDLSDAPKGIGFLVYASENGHQVTHKILIQ